MFEWLAVQIGFLAEYVFDGLNVVLGGEGSAADYHFVQSHSHCPAVHFLGVAPAVEHFRRFVVQSPRFCEHFLVPPSQPHVFADSEVNDFEDLLRGVVENVLGLYVSVAKVAAVDVLQRLEQFVEHCLQLLGGQSSLQPRVGQIFHH